MEQKHSCASVCDGLPTLSANHPWLVDDKPKVKDYDRDHIFYTTRDPPSQHRFQIPSFLGRRIRGCFHGWVVLSNHPHNDMWSLWNPLTCKIIRLPRLSLRDRDLGVDLTQQCCLSSPPGDHGSIFMLTTENRAIVFCRLDCDRLKWAGMSYAKQMRRITGGHDCVLHNLTCCNGKVYGLHTLDTRGRRDYIIHIDIVVKGTKVVISLLPYVEIPHRYPKRCTTFFSSLIGCCTELFYIMLGRNWVGKATDGIAGAVCVHKLDMENIRWEEMEDLKGVSFFLDLAHGRSVFYSPAIASELGGLHFLDRSGKVIHSYDLKNKTIALSSMPTSHASLMSEHRLTHGEVQYLDKENSESRLLNLPFDVLKTLMECCIGVEYLNFRATCKQCHLAAPMIPWSKGGGLLQTYSLPSPWLMVLHNDRGVISFTDPMFGDEYFIKTPPQLIGDAEIHCSMYGWLLIRRPGGPLMFYNPFTSDIRELPWVAYLENFCFSAPPTSSDCMVVGFTTRLACHVYVHFVAREPSWHLFPLNLCDDRSHSFRSPALYIGLNQYALYNNGRIDYIDAGNEDYTWREGPRSSCESPRQTFLMKCDQQLLLVIMGEFGEPVEVFKLNDSTGWEKAESLGRHTIYISGKTCLCIEAKTPVMANKIYFPRVHSENMKIVFYSLETRRYHTSDVDESFGDFVGTQHHLDPHVWIEPSWS